MESKSLMDSAACSSERDCEVISCESDASTTSIWELKRSCRDESSKASSSSLRPTPSVSASDALDANTELNVCSLSMLKSSSKKRVGTVCSALASPELYCGLVATTSSSPTPPSSSRSEPSPTRPREEGMLSLASASIRSAFARRLVLETEKRS